MSIKQDISDIRKTAKDLINLYSQEITTELHSKLLVKPACDCSRTESPLKLPTEVELSKKFNEKSCSQDIYALTKLIDSFQKLIAYEHKILKEEEQQLEYQEEPETEEEKKTAELYIQKLLEPEVIRIAPKSRTGQDLPPSNHSSTQVDSIFENKNIPPSNPPKGKFYVYDQSLKKFVEEKTDPKNL